MLIKTQSYINHFILSFILISPVSNEKIDSKKDYLCNDGFCFKDEYVQEKYIFYDVNRAEGFNLRRDVYIRVANLVKKINSMSKNFQVYLVLPPWNNLNHWKNRNIDQTKLDWALFFNISSLNQYVPVVELKSLLKRPISLDEIFYLESNHENFGKEEFNKINILHDCSQSAYYQENSVIKGQYWGYSNEISSKSCHRVSFRGTNYFLADKLNELFLKKNLNYFMIDRAEVMIHEEYGKTEYWKCRKSMRISSRLIEKAINLRKLYFGIDDSIDSLYINEVNKRNKNLGGDYIGVHVRRGDFLRYRNSISIEQICKQIEKKLKEYNLTNVFLATDGSASEIKEIKDFLKNYNVINYNPSMAELDEFKDGGVSIIDQLMCAYSKFFIGTKESTFSLRIQEEREILGFDDYTTFNCFCEEENICETSKWLFN